MERKEGVRVAEGNPKARHLWRNVAHPGWVYVTCRHPPIELVTTGFSLNMQRGH